MGKLGDRTNHFEQLEINYVNPPAQIRVSINGVVLGHSNRSIELPWTQSATSTVQG